MATYVLLTKMGPEVLRDVKHREAIGRMWKKAIAEKCPEVRFICHYALLGPYDFLDIYEAPDEAVAAKVSMITLSQGAVKAESWTAVEYGRFLKLLEELG
ncbi:MAG: GYD domain-containing protein [Candidatus Eisenbacteria bacterium]|uniref:GYD domain-containing protein n=1 Tax=Eiseniibacteriota bacterium TaxID=2212470 RepID=A0A938BQE1_UNCEI|nr:GYD domain-containing protein [Candidatus Eisenbacteria bacterium]